MTQQGARFGLSASDAQALVDRIMAQSRADETRVTITAGRRRFLRSADNRITTAGGSDDVSVTITAAIGLRRASVTTNRLDEAPLADAVRRATDLARLAPEDPEALPELGDQAYARIDGYHASTGSISPGELADAAARAITAAEAADAVAAGYLDARAGSTTLATSAGVFGHHESTGVASTLTIRTPDGRSSGWAGDERGAWANVESDRIPDDAVQKCLDWRGTSLLEPGRYDVVLEPTAVGMLMLRMTGAFDARSADEGRSFFARPEGGTRIGEQLFDPRITITSDPGHFDAEVAPFNGDGTPRGPVTWIDGGVLRSLAYSRYWARERETVPAPPPSNLIISGGNDTFDDMIRSTRRGVLVTRLWYIRGLNPRTISYTGLTRDGTFLIEDGRISRPVNNFRFNQSLAEMLANIDMLGQPTRVAASENSSVGTPIVAPAMKVRDFNLASVSEAI